MQQQVSIIGASGRAAAWSATRAGFVPIVIDLFGDRDLQVVARAIRVEAAGYPQSLLVAAQRIATDIPLVYVGALENHPRLLERLARKRRLWGNTAASVRAIRSPEKLAAVLAEHALPCPASGTPMSPPNQGGWLVKPRRSAAGRGIRFWHGAPVARSQYLQQFIEGTPGAAVFRAKHAEVEPLGVTRQLIGCSWLNAGGFHYCGSIGPWRLPDETTTTLHQMGRVLTREFGLRGLFGIDFVLQNGIAWPVEINPRYTASVEVLERARGIAALADHGAPFDAGLGALPLLPHRNGIHGKAILFAEREIVFPADGPWLKSLDQAWRDPFGPEFADIPHPGTVIPQGQPILTVFACAESFDACEKELRKRSQIVYQSLGS